MDRSPTRGRPFSNRWRFLWPPILAAALVATIAVTFSLERSRRTESIRLEFVRAVEAIDRARAAGASSWAPSELAKAESLNRAALAAVRRLEVRWWLLPDARRLAGDFREAAGEAAKAASLSAGRRRSAEKAADEALEAAGLAVAATLGLADSIHLAADRRALLSRARLALREAEVYRRDGDHANAILGADRARALALEVSDHAAVVAGRYAAPEMLDRWRRWKKETIDWSRRQRRAAIVVSKEAHTLTLFVSGEAVKSYGVELGFNWIADKQHAGDGATPEGRYRVVRRKAGGASIYHKALLLDYPNAEDRARFARARRGGMVPTSASIGGLIEIHGGGGRGRDWTNGCIAMTNRDIDDLFGSVQEGTPVTVVGSDEYGTIARFAARYGETRSNRQ